MRSQSFRSRRRYHPFGKTTALGVDAGVEEVEIIVVVVAVVAVEVDGIVVVVAAAAEAAVVDTADETATTNSTRIVATRATEIADFREEKVTIRADATTTTTVEETADEAAAFSAVIGIIVVADTEATGKTTRGNLFHSRIDLRELIINSTFEATNNIRRHFAILSASAC